MQYDEEVFLPSNAKRKSDRSHSLSRSDIEREEICFKWKSHEEHFNHYLYTFISPIICLN